jgi:putative MATE family efflux protein
LPETEKNRATAPPGRARNALVEGPIGRTLVVFALPVLGSNVLQSLNGSVNSIWVGRLLGEAALTATTNGNLVLFLLLGTVFGLGLAATILVGQAIGAGDIDRAKQVIGASAVFFAVLSLTLAVVGYIFTDTILRILGTPPDAIGLAGDYLRVIFLALPLLNFTAFLMTVLRGAGDSRTPFYFMALAVFIDAGTNPFFILGIGPFPKMGIAGAAASTLLAQLITVAAFLAVIYGRKDRLRLTRDDLHYLRADPALLRIIIFKGIPMGLQVMVISVSALILISLVNAHGSHQAAAYGAAAQLWTYVQMPAIAIGAAVSTMTAQNVGANRWDRVNRITAAGIVSNLVLTGSLILFLFLAGRLLFGLFLPSDSEAVLSGVHINNIVVWSFALFGVTIVIFGTVRATGAVTAPLVILFITTIVIRAGFAAGLQSRFGVDAIWWSFPVSSTMSTLLALVYYRWGNWRKKPMMPMRPAAEAPETGLGMAAEDVELEPEVIAAADLGTAPPAAGQR